MTSSMAIVATTRFNGGLKNLGLGEGKPPGWSSSLALENISIGSGSNEKLGM